MAYIVAIDIGSSQITTVIGEYNPEVNELEIRGTGLSTTKGYRKGTIEDVKAVGESISRSAELASIQAGVLPLNAFVGISGITSRIINNTADIQIRNKKNIITQEDLATLLSISKDVIVDEDEKVTGVIPLKYKLDGKQISESPVGLIGGRLSMDSAVVAILLSEAKKIDECMRVAGIGISGYIPATMAVEEKILTREERELGAVLIDVGGLVTDIALIRGSNFIFNTAIPVGGNHITNDIAAIMGISKQEAEEFKKNFGSSISPEKIEDIVNARLREIFAIVEWVLEEGVGKQWDVIGAVVTGRGAVYLPNSKEIAQNILGVPIRIVTSEDAGIERSEKLVAIALAEFVCRRYTETGISNIVKSLSEIYDKKRGIYSFFKSLFKKFYIQ